MPEQTRIKAKRMTRKQIEAALNGFEKQHGMSSRDFFEKFQAGQLADSREFVLWSGYYRMLQASKPAKAISA